MIHYFLIRIQMENAFKIVADNYVNEESGTGVVHQAPYFGEDDYRVCLAYGIISKDQKNMVCPVDASGRFTYPVTDFMGQYVKVILTLFYRHFKFFNS